MPENYVDIFVFKNEELTLNIFNSLKEKGYDEVYYYEDEARGTYNISCSEDIEDEVRYFIVSKMREKINVYLTPMENLELDRYIDAMAEEGYEAELESSMTAETFVSAKDKYENVKSSAVSLIVVGAAGLIFIALNLAGVFSMLGKNNILMTITMSIMFVIFLIMGVLSMKSVKVLKHEIGEEESLEKDIREYIDNDLRLEAIEKNIDIDLSNEEKCLFRSEAMVKELCNKFPEATKTLVEHLVEEKYDELYPEDFK